MTDSDERPCLFCSGTGRDRPEKARTPPAEETERQAVSLVTLALDHGLAGDRDAYTEEELLAVIGDRPAASVMALLAAVSSITAHVIYDGSPDDAAARERWQRIAKYLLSDNEGDGSPMTTTSTPPSATPGDERPGKWIDLAPYGFSRYECRSAGGYGLEESAWPIRHKVKGTSLKVTLGTHGYPQVKPYNDQGKQEARTVHGLIMLANVGRPKPGQETRHLNSDPLDYRWAPGSTDEEIKANGGNLVYGSKAANHADQVAAGTAVQPRTQPCVNHATCGGMVVNEGSRCLPCVTDAGERAAAMYDAGISLERAAIRLGYGAERADWVYRLAVRFGGYTRPVGEVRAQGRTLPRRVMASLRYRLKV